MKKGIRKSRGEITFACVNSLLLILLCFAILYPMLMVIARSLMSDVERATHPLRIIPTGIDLSGYRFILSSDAYVRHGYFITIARTLIGTTLSLITTSMLAYPLSKHYYPGRKVITAMLVFTMWFGGGMIPTFIVIKTLKLIDTFWVLILPMMINVYNTIILRNFFMQIPDSLEESAKLDGGNDFQIFTLIYLPLSKAALATISLFYAIWHWNQWFDALLYINKQSLWPLQYILRQIITSASAIDVSSAAATFDAIPAMETVKMATIVISTLPILCAYPFLQKYFVKGVMVGSVKG